MNDAFPEYNKLKESLPEATSLEESFCRNVRALSVLRLEEALYRKSFTTTALTPSQAVERLQALNFYLTEFRERGEHIANCYMAMSEDLDMEWSLEHGLRRKRRPGLAAERE